VYPRNAVTEVLTLVMVRTPLGSSSMYTPGYVGATGIGLLLGARSNADATNSQNMHAQSRDMRHAPRMDLLAVVVGKFGFLLAARGYYDPRPNGDGPSELTTQSRRPFPHPLAGRGLRR
jgi:hypothetical protein